MRSETIIAVVCLFTGIAFTGSTAQSIEQPAGRRHVIVANEGKEGFATQTKEPTNKNFTTWAISYSRSSGLRSAGRSFSLDSNGNLKKQIQNNKTEARVLAEDLQEISKLLQKLNLVRAKTKTAKGHRIYDFPHWHFTIELDGKRFFMEGFASYDENFVVLTKNQKQAYAKLNAKLIEVSAAR